MKRSLQCHALARVTREATHKNPGPVFPCIRHPRGQEGQERTVPRAHSSNFVSASSSYRRRANRLSSVIANQNRNLYCVNDNMKRFRATIHRYPAPFQPAELRSDRIQAVSQASPRSVPTPQEQSGEPRSVEPPGVQPGTVAQKFAAAGNPQDPPFDQVTPSYSADRRSTYRSAPWRSWHPKSLFEQCSTEFIAQTTPTT
jgi:hypothetical protein